MLSYFDFNLNVNFTVIIYIPFYDYNLINIQKIRHFRKKTILFLLKNQMTSSKKIQIIILGDGAVGKTSLLKM